MNYLAHLLLGPTCDDALVGSLLGDFVKGPLAAWEGPERQRTAIALHRAIDSHTDAHPVWRRSRTRLQLPRLLAGGIVVDLAYDHFLARAWQDYAPEPLPEFSQRVYAALSQRAHGLPQRLRTLLPHLIGEDWLCGYHDPDSVPRALHGIARRLARPDCLAQAAERWQEHQAALKSDFDAFFPDLIAFAAARGGRAQWVVSRRSAPPPQD